MRITIIGAGYVGLVSGACLAELGHEVQMVERAPARLAALRAGRVPFSEPGLDKLLAQHSARISVSQDIGKDGPGDLTFVAVGTPIGSDDSDLSQLRSAAEMLAHWRDAHVSFRSTLPPGLSYRLPGLLGRADGRHLSTNPEFLRQGDAIQDFLHPSRIVWGRFPETAGAHLSLLEAAYEGVPGPRVVVDVASAELVKNIANAYLALKLSFVNEVAALTEEYGGDIDEVLRGIGLDERIGSSYMRPGLGFGGSCLPKELQVLAIAGRKKGLAMHVARAASLANVEHQERFARSIIETLDGAAHQVGMLGLSFKANTDDLRGSPALTVARRLLEAGYRVVAHDPAVPRADAEGHVSGLVFVERVEQVFEGSAAIVIATEWPAFRELPWAVLRRRMRGRQLFDGRNLLDPAAARAAGYAYSGIGRPVPAPTPSALKT